MKRLVLLALLVFLAVPTKAAAAVRSYALVVGNNAPHRPDAATLRYADDDALRMQLLFSALEGRVLLHAEPDADTRATRELSSEELRPVTVAAIESSLRELAAEVAGARAAGWETAFYFFFAGHGDRRHFESLGRESSFIQLDRPLPSAELYALLDQVQAHRTHVLVDACHSLDLVAGRGDEHPDEPDIDLQRIVGDFFAESSLRERPDVGVVVSSTPENTTLESHRLRAGVFTYVVRSGMLGAADLDEDLRVSYGEIEAFARVATFPSGDAPRLVEFLAEPPRGQRDAPLIDLNRAQAALLRIPPQQQTRYQLSDPRGEPYAAFYGAANVTTQLMLVGAGAFRLSRWDRQAREIEAELELTAEAVCPRHRLTLDAPLWRPPSQGTTPRGGAELALFRQPHGPFTRASALRGKRAMLRATAPEEPRRRRVLVMGLDAPAGDTQLESLRRAMNLALVEAVHRRAPKQRFEILSEEDVSALVPSGGLRDELKACADNQCPYEELAGALGDVAFVVHGQVARGSAAQLLYSASSFDIPAARVAGRISGRLAADASPVARFEAGLNPLLAWLPPESAKPAKVSPPEEMSPWTEISLAAAAPTDRRPWAYTALAASVGAAAGGGVVAWYSRRAKRDFGRCQSVSCRNDASGRHDRALAGAAALFATSGLLLGGGLTLLLWPADAGPGAGATIQF